MSDRVALGHRARALLDDPTFQEVMSTLERDFTAAWLSTNADGQIQREALYYMARSVNAIRLELGKMADVVTMDVARTEEAARDVQFAERNIPSDA